MEVQLNVMLQSITNPIFDMISNILAIIGDNGIMYIIIAIIMMCMVKFRKQGIFLFLNLGVCGVIGMVLKKLIGRERPCFAYPELVTCAHKESQFTSMPSGHMIMASAFVFVMCKYFPKYKVLWVSYLILMGLSRMYLGAHFISDLLLALALAFMVFVITNVVFKKYIYPWLKKKRIVKG